MISIFCPSGCVTGGVEALHQLCYKLNLLGFEACICYNQEGCNQDSVPPVYRKYRPVYVDTLYDSAENIIVFPEVFLDPMCGISEAQIVIWWLSVDFASYSDETAEFIKNNKKIIHLCQSKYATDFIRAKFGVEDERIFRVSDYLNSEFITAPKVTYPREDVVLFNPKKGFSVTSALIGHSDYRIKWQALAGMTPAKMHETMQKAKVYVDFGSHPGKDRIPREAALSGCLILTNRAGSAANDVDVAIPSCYKFDSADHEGIIRKILEMFASYDEKQKDFAYYRERTRHEFQEYEADVLHAFLRITGTDILIPKEELLERIKEALASSSLEEACRLLVYYRFLGLSENADFAILECSIRLALGEIHEAKFCVEEALSKYPDNYELLMILVQLLLEEEGTDEAICDTLEQIKILSKGSVDEEACLSFADSVYALLEGAEM